MLIKLITTTLIIGSLAVNVVHAKGLAPKMSCADLLAQVIPPAASQFHYEISDFEGLYLDIVRDAVLYNEVRDDKRSYFAEQFLNKKANFLNDAIYVVRRLMINKMHGEESPITPDQVYSMIASLGVDPQMYGFKVAENNNVSLPVPEQNQKGPQHKEASTPPSKPEDQPLGFIGFIENRNASVRDLPDHLSRAIGFGRDGITREAAPNRKVGQLQISFDEKTKSLIVLDPSDRLQFTADIQMMTFSGAQTDSKIMKLMFDQDQTEWIISFENTANPSGHIGFVFPKK